MNPKETPNNDSSSAIDSPTVRIPINHRRVMYILGGAALALITAIAVVVGLVRANDGVPASDIPDRGPVLQAGEVQAEPNLPVQEHKP